MSKSKLRKEYENVMGTVDCTLKLFNAAGQEVYYEMSDGFWVKTEYNEAGQVVYVGNSLGSWSKTEYNEAGKQVYVGNSEGLWSKYEYNEEGEEVYYEHSDGTVRDNRPNKAKIFTDEDGTKYKVEVTQ